MQIVSIITVAILFGAVVYLFLSNIVLSHKNSYYEQTIINHRDKFSPERFAKIMQIKNKKFLDYIWELINFNE